ncbi:hypothetical protein KO481_27170 [Nocardia sp. NEAU-G5]|uniref:Excreted virulence factor EspC (Type VII ESX diderm) n=1 Tax=Nocardia albiluteola TaxID=2842303 RepID=A0ABS6B4F3_9NOCA|nr:type VII secretion target [Nocardia albiluteola]MBU3065195.1 hypothetical protein [Nocardia albiluteola]
MDLLQVEPNTFRQYGDIAAGTATAVAAVGAVDQAASIAAAVPVFGLIGQEFLTSFAYAQANHFTAVNQLATVFATTATAAHTAAGAYEQAERCSMAGFAATTGTGQQ